MGNPGESQRILGESQRFRGNFSESWGIAANPRESQRILRNHSESWGNVSESWAISVTPGESQRILGNLSESWGISGNPGESQRTLGNLSESWESLQTLPNKILSNRLRSAYSTIALSVPRARSGLHAPWPQKVTLFLNDFSSFFFNVFWMPSGAILAPFWDPFGVIFRCFFQSKIGLIFQSIF